MNSSERAPFELFQKPLSFSRYQEVSASLLLVSISERGAEGMLNQKSWLPENVWELPELNRIYMGDEMSQRPSCQRWWKPIELPEVVVARTES